MSLRRSRTCEDTAVPQPIHTKSVMAMNSAASFLNKGISFVMVVRILITDSKCVALEFFCEEGFDVENEKKESEGE